MLHLVYHMPTKCSEETLGSLSHFKGSRGKSLEIKNNIWVRSSWGFGRPDRWPKFGTYKGRKTQW